ncbi:g950 [Coccomyxa viridis]|uniref:G950 protein n=1 Tax=Coccomyxa viridis TaxID=1274662 RepID=A0ABP1FNQ1_9CHLO
MILHRSCNHRAEHHRACSLLVHGPRHRKGHTHRPRAVQKEQQQRSQDTSTEVLTKEVAPDEAFDWVVRYQSRIRVAPLIAGGIGITGVLANRLFSGIAPVVDASSAQSRADVLAIGLSAVTLLIGLQWISLTPRKPVQVEPAGSTASFISTALPQAAQAELRWMWAALQACSRCRGVVVIHHERCVMHCGIARTGHQPGTASLGPIAKGAIGRGAPNYLANLILFPGRVEFTEYFPEDTQGVLVQPIGDEGVLVIATDTQRGFGRLDQAWIASIADKMDIALSATTTQTVQ